MWGRRQTSFKRGLKTVGKSAPSASRGDLKGPTRDPTPPEPRQRRRAELPERQPFSHLEPSLVAQKKPLLS